MCAFSCCTDEIKEWLQSYSILFMILTLVPCLCCQCEHHHRPWLKTIRKKFANKILPLPLLPIGWAVVFKTDKWKTSIWPQKVVMFGGPTIWIYKAFTDYFKDICGKRICSFIHTQDRRGRGREGEIKEREERERGRGRGRENAMVLNWSSKPDGFRRKV